MDAKQALELEIERLKGNLNVLKHMGGDEDEAFKKKMDEMGKNLEEKEGELESLEDLNQTLIVKERKSNDELQEARKELILVSALSQSLHIFSVWGLFRKISKLFPFDNVVLIKRLDRRVGKAAANVTVQGKQLLTIDFIKVV